MCPVGVWVCVHVCVNSFAAVSRSLVAFVIENKSVKFQANSFQKPGSQTPKNQMFATLLPFKLKKQYEGETLKSNMKLNEDQQRVKNIRILLNAELHEAPGVVGVN